MEQQRTAAATQSTQSKRRFDAAEEIPIFDWRDLEADVESVLATCSSDDDESNGRARAASISGTCRFQNASS